MTKKNPAAVALGSIKSPRKAASSRANGRKGGAPTKWRPIETAPKDGTRVLIATDWETVLIAAWKEDAAFERCKREPGWQVLDCEDCWYSWSESTPTHWMPLPQPPDSPEHP